MRGRQRDRLGYRPAGAACPCGAGERVALALRSACVRRVVWALALTVCALHVAGGCQRAPLRSRPVVFRGVYDGPSVTAAKSGDHWSVAVVLPTDKWTATIDEQDPRALIHDVYVTLRRPAEDASGVGEAVQRIMATQLTTGVGLRVNVRVIGPHESATEREPPYHQIVTASP